MGCGGGDPFLQEGGKGLAQSCLSQCSSPLLPTPAIRDSILFLPCFVAWFTKHGGCHGYRSVCRFVFQEKQRLGVGNGLGVGVMKGQRTGGERRDLEGGWGRRGSERSRK